MQKLVRYIVNPLFLTVLYLMLNFFAWFGNLVEIKAIVLYSLLVFILCYVWLGIFFTNYLSREGSLWQLLIKFSLWVMSVLLASVVVKLRFYDLGYVRNIVVLLIGGGVVVALAKVFEKDLNVLGIGFFSGFAYCMSLKIPEAYGVLIFAVLLTGLYFNEYRDKLPGKFLDYFTGILVYCAVYALVLKSSVLFIR